MDKQLCCRILHRIQKIMQNLDFTSIKLNQLQIFIAAVDYGNFSAAARFLNVTQPMVTKTIQSLEQELGIILFIREKNKVKLTPAGKECYEQWSRMIKIFLDSVRNAHDLQEGSKGSLQIGLGSLSIYNTRAIDRFKLLKEKFGVTPHIEFRSMSTLLKELKDGTRDVIMISKHLLPEIDSLGCKWLLFEESMLSVFIPDNNPLFKKDTVSFEDLRCEQFISFSPETDPSYVKLLNMLASDAGFVPKISCYITDELSFKPNLILGNGVALTDESTNMEDEHIKRFNLNIRNDLILVWDGENTNSSLKYISKI